MLLHVLFICKGDLAYTNPRRMAGRKELAVFRELL